MSNAGPRIFLFLNFRRVDINNIFKYARKLTLHRRSTCDKVLSTFMLNGNQHMFSRTQVTNEGSILT